MTGSKRKRTQTQERANVVPQSVGDGERGVAPVSCASCVAISFSYAPASQTPALALPQAFQCQSMYDVMLIVISFATHLEPKLAGT